MVLKAADLLEDIGYSLSGEPGESSPALRVVNEAGSLLCALRSWNWLKNRTTVLGARKSFSFTGGAWTTATKALLDTQFDGYTYVAGDSVLITGGTNVNVGRYDISAFDDGTDTLTLESEITTDSSDQTDIAGTLDLDFLRLPDDFAQLDAQKPTEAITSTLEMVTLEQIVDFRTNPVQVTQSYYYGALAYRDVAGQQKPVIELWPAPTADDQDQFRLFYGAKWRSVDDDDDTIQLPQWEVMEGLLRQLCRAVARGYEDEEDDELRMSQRVREIKMGDFYRACVRMDGKAQRNYGPIRNGHAKRMIARRDGYYLPTEASLPS